MMPPEEPSGLIALWLEVEGDSLSCRGERVFATRDPLKVSWYTAVNVPPEGYDAVLNGVVFAYKDSVSRVVKIDRFCPTRVGNQWEWRDHAGPHGLMLALVLPPQYALVTWDPPLVEAKRFLDRIAVFWLLYSESQTRTDVTASWSIAAFPDTLEAKVESLNRAFVLARKRERPTDYDVALSFAGEDRSYVEEVAHALSAAGVKVFYDKLEEAELWGKNLYTHLSDVYGKRARFTVMFISRWYAKKRWTNFEREAAQAKAFAESREYILPARFDETEVPGILSTTSYVSVRERSPEEFARLILRKLESIEPLK